MINVSLINVSLINVFLVIFLTLCGVAHAGFSLNPFTGRMDKTSDSVSSGWSIDGSTTTETTMDVVIGGDLNVSGETTLDGNLTVGGSISAGVSGDSTIDGSITVQGFTDLTANEPVGGVWAGNYISLTSDDHTDANFAGGNNITVFNNYRMTRIRQNGVIKGVRIYTKYTQDAESDDITGFFISVWRNVRGTNLFDRVGITESLHAQLSAGSVNTLTTTAGFSVREGDYVALTVTSEGDGLDAPYGPFDAAGVGVNAYAVVGAVPSTTNFAWRSQIGLTATPIDILVESSPQVVFIGDSIMSGSTHHLAYTENAAQWDDTLTSIPFKTAQKLGGVTYQNMGIAGNTTWQIAARFTTDVTDLQPKVVVIEGGVNDLVGTASPTTTAEYIALYTGMLNQCRAAGIKAVLLTILPATLKDATAMTERDEKVAALKALVSASYSDIAVTVDASEFVGRFRKDQVRGNRWDMQARYNQDNLHYNPDGHEAIATSIARGISSKVMGSLEVGDLWVGDRIGFKPTPQTKYIELDRTQYEIDNYVYGASLVIGAGGAMPLQFNQNGGDLILSSGASTGTGSSGVAIWTTTSSTSTTFDNQPTPSVTVTGKGMLVDDAIYANSSYFYIKQEDGGCSKCGVDAAGTTWACLNKTCPTGM